MDNFFITSIMSEDKEKMCVCTPSVKINYFSEYSLNFFFERNKILKFAAAKGI